MEMSHLGYIGYTGMVLAIYGSPVVIYLLYAGWKRGRLLLTLLGLLFAWPLVSALAYGLFLGGLHLMAALSR